MFDVNSIETGLLVRFPVERLSTQDLSRLFRDFDFLTADLVQFDMYRLGYDILPRRLVPRPHVSSLRMGSPIDLALEASNLQTIGLVGGLSLLAYALRHPREIGGWLPDIVSSWREGWSELERANRQMALERATQSESPAGTIEPEGAPQTGVPYPHVQDATQVDQSADDPLLILLRRTVLDARRLEELAGEATVVVVGIPEDPPQA